MTLRSIVVSSALWTTAALAQPAPPTAVSILRLAGAYQISAGREVVISLQRAPGIALPLMTDIATGRVRVLFPSGPNAFSFGRELTRPAPAEGSVQFHMRGDQADSLTITDGDGRITARRHRLRAHAVQLHRDGVTLHGTLLLPARLGRSALVVFAAGSEDSDRHSLGPLAYALAAQGTAVLTYDKRGTGESNGSWEDAGLEPLAADLAAFTDLASRRPEIDPARIGVLGFSEGGWLAPMAARGSRSISFIVAISGGGTTKANTFVYKTRRRAEETGAAVDSAVRNAEALMAESASRVRTTGATGFDRRVTYNPTADWEAFRGPVLSIGGEFDVLDNARESADSLRAIFRRSGISDRVVIVLPKAHHFPFMGKSGQPSEWAGLAGVSEMVPGFWDILLRWFDARGLTRPRGGGR